MLLLEHFLNSLFVSIEALDEGWSLCIPAADITWMTDKIADIVDIPVNNIDRNFQNFRSTLIVTVNLIDVWVR